MQQFKTLQEMFADPKRWTQLTSARDADGEVVDPTNTEKVASFCLLGGLMNVYHGADRGAVTQKLYKVMDEFVSGRECCTVSSFNDTHTYADVLALIKKANV